MEQALRIVAATPCIEIAVAALDRAFTA